ncbi:multicopper oxidase [Trichoderma asperellum CBS 433.97]|uniref:Multicopper oxidase n=1 Tax=Trichoderma asperellum (strain ATCC 204424 / CBS 433.97 / NBRC 101777) TaxID=1042311 RepID=A0A2T3ZKD5_TRIA4|nr:multicopper oxidase [Trichoderma asperellum CBS 433.97]PTB45270.1 multicopper oxidase [Trichoderma asperellum CBS 433.97]
MHDANLTMHWHGLAQAAAPFSDGTPMASQWPIPPQHYFDYELKTPAGTAGTYFYHSHIDFQTSTANGPLIVDDSSSQGVPYPVDGGDRIIHITELFYETDNEVSAGLKESPFKWSGEAGGILVNGGTISSYHVLDPASAKLTVIDVEPGKSYRFRFIGAMSLSYVALAFEDHPDLKVIEVDGGYTKPYSTPLLQIGTGQRFSTLFRAKTCAELQRLGKLDFYLQLEPRDRPNYIVSYAVLRYRNTCGIGGNAHVSTTSVPWRRPINLPPTIEGFLDYKLEPLYPNDFPSAAEVTRRVHIYTQQQVDKYVLWTNNDVSWVDDDPLPPQVTPGEPYLVSLYKNTSQYLPNYEAAIANYGLDPRTKTYPAKLGEVIEIVFQQLGQRNTKPEWRGGLDTHPWHAHGNHIYDIGGGPGVYSPEIAEQRLRGTNPIRRDTSMLFRYTRRVEQNQPWGWRAWRVRVQDPGVWMIHCHMLQHMIMGMQTVWVFGDAHDLLRANYPDVTGYLVYGGNVNGNATHPAEVVHFFEAEEAA